MACSRGTRVTGRYPSFILNFERDKDWDLTELKFEVTILGCGSAAPTLNRGPSAQVVEVRNRHFLVDCGEGTQVQLRKRKIKFQRIRHIFISHLHGDHFFGLIGLMSTYHLLGREYELTIYGPKGLEEIIRVQLKWTQTPLRYPLKFVETSVEGKQRLFEDELCEVHSFPVNHRVDCTGFLFSEKPAKRKLLPKELEARGVSLAYAQRIKDGEDGVTEDGTVVPNDLLSSPPPAPRSYAYCADTLFSPDIANHVPGVDLMYHEATFLDNLKDRARKTHHSTASEAAEVAKAAEAKQLLLGHFSARYKNLDAFKEEAQAVFPNTELAEDGMVVRIS